MDMIRFLSISCVFALFCCVVCSRKVRQRLEILENDIDILSDKFDNEKAAILNNQRKEILALETRLDSSMEEKVTQALEKIISSEVYRGIIKSKVDEEVTHLRRSHQEMRHGFQKMRRTLELLQEENQMFKKVLQKEPRCQCKTGDVSKPTQTSNHSSGSTTNTTSCPVSSTVASTTTRQPRLTTPAPEERNNILVVPRWKPSKHHPRLVNIKNNILSTYSYFNLRKVDSVLYVQNINSLYISLFDPGRILASKLNSSSVNIIKHNVMTYGMAEDQSTSTIFFTTYSPKYTINKMAYDGNNFNTVVSLSVYDGNPRTIALDTNTHTIYACTFKNLLSVRYNGSGLTILDTGININAVTLDIINGVLYYSNDRKLMKHSVSTTTSTEVTELPDYMWNLVYYRDVVYYMSYHGILGSVDVGQNNVATTLQIHPVSGVSSYSICLIP